MPCLRPPPPDEHVRCTQSNGKILCWNPKIRCEPLCHSHLHLHHQRKPKTKKRPNSSPAKKRKLKNPPNNSPVKKRANNSQPPPPPPPNNSIVEDPIPSQEAETPQKDFPIMESDVIDPPSSKSSPPNSSEFMVLPSIAEILRRFTAAKAPKPGQIWALPHESDGLPRSYARVDGLDLDKSTVEIAPLEFHPVSPHEFYCAENKLPVSCGTFRAQNSRFTKEISGLCHQIGWESDVKVSELKSFYRIYPKKGEIWAIYREPDGNESSLFKLVEVVEGFNEEKGFAGFVELKGVEVSKGEIEVKLGCGLIQRFSMAELMVFSHRVPVLEEVVFGK